MSQTAFLLAFQEPVAHRSDLNRESNDAAIALGTKTLTEVRGEAADKDRHEGSLFTIPAGDLQLGTMTRTEQRAEAADKDPDEGSFFTIPARDLQLGTMTKTAVRAETPDSDPGALGMTVLPSPASAIAVSTAN